MCISRWVQRFREEPYRDNESLNAASIALEGAACIVLYLPRVLKHRRYVDAPCREK